MIAQIIDDQESFIWESIWLIIKIFILERLLIRNLGWEYWEKVGDIAKTEIPTKSLEK